MWIPIGEGLAHAHPRSTRSLFLRFAATLLCGATIAASDCFPAGAQSQPSAAQRRAAISRIIDGINSPDPAVRLSTLESATEGKDATLRHLALSTALANADSTLRFAALVEAFATTPSFVVDITSFDRDRTVVMKAVGGRFLIRPSRFNRTTDTFAVTTLFSEFDRDEHPVAQTGEISGDRVSFRALERTNNHRPCEAVLELAPSGSTLKGTLSCSFSPERYEIQMDLLR